VLSSFQMRRQSTFAWSRSRFWARAPKGALRLSRALKAWFVGALVLVGCATNQLSPNAGPTSNATNAAGAAITAVAAGVVWAAGGGCKLQGCPYGSYCDTASGFCEVRKCSQGCPADTVCNEGLDRCQVAPPAAPPSDLLPEDNLLTHPPTVH